MKNKKLASLNFEKLLVYNGGAPAPKHRYETALKCLDFCVSCEDKGLLKGAPFWLRQISHACDTSDHESVLQTSLPAPPSGYIDAAILFLLESPGGQEHNGNRMKHPRLDVEKIPPVNSYYYTPDPCVPWNISPLDKYGPYFAYLMGHFGLQNVYITNAVKCGRVSVDKSFQPFRGSRDPIEKAVRRNCYDEFLKVEVSILQPVLVLAFGGNAYTCSDFLRRDYPHLPVLQLYHPNARGYSMAQVRDINDPKIESALKGVGLL